ncbi:MAG TPA: multidrug resistance efflux transporter family protein [Candidatus Pseudogracilibacillus intestinigallinarum]|uniref:Multidrug resistance efflux transporter family protein n=1 Tax=Candidatus Pseudogracilibacillus intestinigallinarum TaxID=2838742 RepID=A0A9D1PLH1_9BACI|nr:multidrug resistance efflux transporter family protein [Candidatus Pseudogracilibacillus intestinigallinarum]
MRPIFIGLLAALFFSFAFIFNRNMELAGGSWIWSASIRFFFMLPMLLIFVRLRKQVLPVLHHIKKYPKEWIIWSTIGFCFFYAPLTFATIHAPGWLVAATFQLNIVAGSLLVPFINKSNRSIPIQSVFISIIIIIGIFMMQMEHAENVPIKAILLSVLPMIVAAISYPLGNRKMMQLVNGELNSLQRVLGMTIASMPFWILLSIFGAFSHGAPTQNQLVQVFIVAVFSGVIATILFFYATDLVRHDNHKLAGVESTSAGEVVFALLGEMLLLGFFVPSFMTIIGLILVIFGIILHSILSRLQDKRTLKSNRAVS